MSTHTAPPPLLPFAPAGGAAVGVLSPSSDEAGRFPRRRDRAVAQLEALGHPVRFGPHALDTGGHTAASAEDRVKDLHALFTDPGVGAVLTAIGGNNTNDMLDLVDYGLLAAHPKPLIGYSDATALLTAVWKHTGLVTVMGPQLLPQFGEPGGCLAYTRESWQRVLGGTAPGPLAHSTHWTDEFLAWDETDDRARVLRPNPGPTILREGVAEGPLYGANLETLLRLAGTRHWPTTAGHLLLLETSPGITPSQLAAYLTQLRQTGALAGAAAVGFGRFAQAGPGDEALNEVLAEGLLGTGHGPVVRDLDIGHTDPMFCVPYGVRAGLTAQDGTCLLTLPDPATRPSPTPLTATSRERVPCPPTR
ncbi:MULTISPECIES: S66 peptidase family protein [unclassified Streptomyces]|uniref:S66 family peptidase n=1 Tax=unclassified Streptomyces TaxID=2593676 RepID=UPI000379D35B|nr:MULTISPECIES: S66 peptidase family protein [unclassified Streptomyces]MYY04498.1 LD-carboxypeptidase [Streptomyces sp. SID4913]